MVLEISRYTGLLRLTCWPLSHLLNQEVQVNKTSLKQTCTLNQPVMSNVSLYRQSNWTITFHTCLTLKRVNHVPVMDSTARKTQFWRNYTFKEILKMYYETFTVTLVAKCVSPPETLQSDVIKWKQWTIHVRLPSFDCQWDAQIPLS